MSVKGLQQSERIASGVRSRVKKTLDATADELQLELEKLQYILSDLRAARQWARSPANADKLAQIRARMTEVEQLYMDAGDTTAARIFRTRMQKLLRQRLTNLQAAEADLSTLVAKGRCNGQAELLTGLTQVRREGAIGEMYAQARKAGGFLVDFGRPYLSDVITLETKAAGSKTIGKYMADLYTRYEAQVKNVFINGIVRGDSYEMMTKGLADATGLSKRKASLIVNTEANAVFNESVREVIDDNPLVKGYRFRAVLDARTSKLCQEHDGEYIPKDKIEPGVNYPPLHPNCRSTVTTVLMGEDERVDTVQRYTKNGRNQWEKVPPGMTYQEYKDKFGFANSKNPRTYNPVTRDIHDATLASITPVQYKGYVKPSRSATARIQKSIKAYVDNDQEYMQALQENTKFDRPGKALTRQAQAESGFDGLPLQQTSRQFDKEVQKNGYKVLWRQFKNPEDLDSFLNKEGLFGTGNARYGAGTYTFESEPQDTIHGATTIKMALRSGDSKILSFTGARDSAFDIGLAQTPDARINAVLEKTPQEKRIDVFTALATEYGYDAVEVQTGRGSQYMVVLNRTALIVEKPSVQEASSYLSEEEQVLQYADTLENKDVRDRLKNSPVLDQLDMPSAKAYVSIQNGRYIEGSELISLAPVQRAEQRNAASGVLWSEDSPMSPEVRQEVDKVYSAYLSDLDGKKKEKKVSIILGLPASGKSSVADRLVEEQGAFLADSDEVKKLFVPKVLGDGKDYYQKGNGANYIHDASSYINAKALQELTRDGTNIVLPIVGKSEKSVQKYYDMFSASGYDMRFYMVELPKKKAMGRSFSRFVNEGRYVSLEYLNSISVEAIRGNFDKFKKMEGASYYARLDNDVNRGEAPRVLETSDKD